MYAYIYIITYIVYSCRKMDTHAESDLAVNVPLILSKASKLTNQFRKT